MTPDPGSEATRRTAGTAAVAVISSATALAALLMFVRFHWIDHYAFTAYFVPAYLFDLLMISFYDLSTIAIATGVSLGFVLVLRNRQRGLRTVRAVFAAFSLTALTFAVVNQQVIGMLGAPVNYQWLEYSDFLTSMDAKEALSGSFSWLPVFAVAVLVLGWMLGALGLRRLLADPARRRRCLLIGVVACIAYFSFMTRWLWRNPRYYLQANPMVALVESFLITEKPSIFTMPTAASTADLTIVADRETVPPVTSRGVQNVIFFVLESTAAEYIETHGEGVAPNLARVKGRSRTFTSAYAHAPTTNKSIVSMFCSIYPWVSNHSLTKRHADNKLVTLPRVLGEKGYRTAFFNSADLRHGRAGRFLTKAKFQVTEDHRTRETELEGYVDPDGYELMNASDDMATTNSLIDWMAKDPDKPFLGVVWTMGTHYPYHYRDEQVDYGVPKPRGQNRYLNAMRHADRCLGRVFDKLDELELTEKTLVVVVGDHGEAFGQHRGNWSHATRIYEENIRVPLVLVNPKLFHGGERDTLCGMIDLAPTVLDALGLPFPEGWQGRSLLRDWKRGRIYFFAPWSHMLFGFREGDMKYIYHAREDRSVAYDLSKDPKEKRNIIKDLPPRTRDDIKRKLAAWVQYQAKLMAERVVK